MPDVQPVDLAKAGMLLARLDRCDHGGVSEQVATVVGPAMLDEIADLRAKLEQAYVTIRAFVEPVVIVPGSPPACYMHNSNLRFPGVALMHVAIGNKVPLCRPCIDWWLANPETEKGQVTMIVDEAETPLAAESLTSSPAGADVPRLITDARLYSWGPVVHSPWPDGGPR